ncbi:BsuPI-related putative proteinase inhibitor [Bacillus sp. REN16]|uniref:BsuPI-related putative proteinase inhibitor n=1 Tax=Bacillus sp. REN16 TaxID=2887296 RepID=UPI001E396F53|nr:BsuPI-related putative proteinase inhibitor [Bacillus sp. REN16]MCC3355560.1 hypothetical protein [Bacillus sp. REN16]
MRRWLLVALVFVMSLFIMSGCGTSTTDEALPVNSGSGEKVETETPPEQESVEPGGDVNLVEKLQTNLSIETGENEATFTISLKNTNDNSVKVTIPGGQKYEIVVTDANGKEVYRYSIDKMFIQSIEEMELKPGEEKVWEEPWDYTSNDGTRLAPGEYKATIFSTAFEVNGQEIEENVLQAEENFTIPDEGNTAFRKVQVLGENGEYTVTGEVRVFEATFFYSVEDGHDYVIPETVQNASEGAPAWAPFEIKISIPKDKIPTNGALILHLYERSAKDGSITNLYHAKLQQFQ